MSNRWYNRTIKNNTKETQKINFKKVNEFMNINWLTEYNNNVRKFKTERMINMKNVVKMFDETQVMGYVKDLTFYNKNGATKTFMNEWMMKNYLNSYGLTIK